MKARNITKNDRLSAIPVEYAKPGIYRFICKGTGEDYIGSSLNIRERYYQLLCMLERADNINSAKRLGVSNVMFKRFQTYGVEDWKFEILEIFEEIDRTALRLKELEAISEYKPTLNRKPKHDIVIIDGIIDLVADKEGPWKSPKVNPDIAINKDTKQVVNAVTGQVINPRILKGGKTYVSVVKDKVRRTYELDVLYGLVFDNKPLKPQIIRGRSKPKINPSDDLYNQSESPRFQPMNIRNFLIKR